MNAYRNFSTKIRLLEGVGIFISLTFSIFGRDPNFFEGGPDPLSGFIFWTKPILSQKHCDLLIFRFKPPNIFWLLDIPSLLNITSHAYRYETTISNKLQEINRRNKRLNQKISYLHSSPRNCLFFSLSFSMCSRSLVKIPHWLMGFLCCFTEKREIPFCTAKGRKIFFVLLAHTNWSNLFCFDEGRK